MVRWRRSLLVIAVGLMLPACGRQTGPSRDEPDRAALVAGIRDYLQNLQWSDMRFGGRCGDSFVVNDVQINDLSLNGQTGAAQTVVTISETNRPQYTGFPWGWCFGSRGAGSTRRLGMEFNLERWDSGWRLSRQQRRPSPF